MHVPTYFDGSDTLSCTSITISDSTIDVPIDNSNGRVDIMQENAPLGRNVLFWGMISSLPLVVWIGTTMMLSEIIILAYYKVSEPSKSVGTCISPVNLCKYCVKRASVLVPKFGTKCTTLLLK